MKKKILSVILVLGMVLGVAACSKGNKSSKQMMIRIMIEKPIRKPIMTISLFTNTNQDFNWLV